MVEVSLGLRGHGAACMNRDDLVELGNLLSLASGLALKAPHRLMSF